MYLTRLQYAPDGDTGGTLPPSLSDLDKPTPPPAEGIQGGDGTKKPDLSEESAKQQKEQGQNDPPADPPEEGVNEDGTLKEGYERDAEGKVVKTEEPKDPPTEDPPGEDDENFYEEVDKLRGETVKIDYPEGVHPQSPEGVYHREKFLEQRAVESFEKWLATEDPRAHAYRLHRLAGGSDEEFFGRKEFSLPEYEEFKTNADLHMRVYKSDLLAKGLDLDSAQVLVDKAVKDGKLFDLADQAYKAAEKRQEKELQDIEAANTAAQQKYQATVQSFDSSLVEAVSESKGLNVIIPDADKKDFLQYVRGIVEYDDRSGKILFVQPAEGEQFSRQLEALYLLYKKGDLKALIQREAQTQNRKRLGKVLEKSKAGQNSGNNSSGASSQDFVPMSAI